MDLEEDILTYHVNVAKEPIRISPNILLLPQPSALKDIYWDPKCNQKMSLYGTGALGPPHLFTTLDSDEHKALRKALGGQQVLYISIPMLETS